MYIQISRLDIRQLITTSKYNRGREKRGGEGFLFYTFRKEKKGIKFFLFFSLLTYYTNSKTANRVASPSADGRTQRRKKTEKRKRLGREEGIKLKQDRAKKARQAGGEGISFSSSSREEAKQGSKGKKNRGILFFLGPPC